VTSCLVYDPYLDTLGGGERYVAALAEVAARRVDVTLAGPVLPEPARWQRLGFPAGLTLETVPAAAFTAASASHDLAVYLANEPPPPHAAGAGALVVQFPFTELDDEPRRRAAQRTHLAGYRAVCYSEFARRWTARRWGVDAAVLGPPVAAAAPDLAAKTATIVHVGRFFADGHCKRQDALVAAHGLLDDDVRRAWRLVLAGGVGHDARSRAYLDDVRRAADAATARGSVVEVHADVDAGALVQLYRQAALAWHATGFGRDPARPEQAEHFGMSVVEAMAWGAVPLVYDDGGPAEVVDDAVGVRWRTLAELADATTALARDADRRTELARAAIGAADAHSRARFDAEALALVDALLAAAG
jgi:O-antigen biosynthesis protein